jgi:hypothetical protein
MMKPTQIVKSVYVTFNLGDAPAALGFLTGRSGSSDDFGRTCQAVSVGRPTCLVTWVLMNLVALLAPRTSLTNGDVTSLGAFALLMIASATQAFIDLRAGRTTGRIKAVAAGEAMADV